MCLQRTGRLQGLTTVVSWRLLRLPLLHSRKGWAGREGWYLSGREEPGRLEIKEERGKEQRRAGPPIMPSRIQAPPLLGQSKKALLMIRGVSVSRDAKRTVMESVKQDYYGMRWGGTWDMVAPRPWQVWGEFYVRTCTRISDTRHFILDAQ